jgi:hypothetical protein
MVGSRSALYLTGAFLQWTRFGDAKIDVVADFTRLTLDSEWVHTMPLRSIDPLTQFFTCLAIALCTFSHRFNS